jgi:riboflavin synthase
MFTGIIETLARLEKIEKEGTNINFFFSSPVTSELKIDQSVAHNGVCLTVVEVANNMYKVTAIQETMQRTNLGGLNTGDLVNIERCMQANGRFDGHIVQGHVDATAVCTEIKDLNGSYQFYFKHEKSPTNVTVEKGSITVNGVSLTVVDSSEESFSVCIIPYTYKYTNFHQLVIGSKVNLEFDIIGKYVARLLANR